MPARIYFDEVDEPVIWNDDGSLIGEMTGTEYEVEPGAIFEAEDGQEQEWREEFEEPTPEFAYRQTLEAQQEAAESHIDYLEDQSARQVEAEVEADAAELIADREHTAFVMRGRERLEAFDEMFRDQRREFERTYGPLNEDEAAGLYDRLLVEHTSGDANATIENVSRQEFPEAPPADGKTTPELLAEHMRDVERGDYGGLTRDDAVAQIDRSGRPQDFRMVEVAPDRFEVVDDGA